MILSIKNLKSPQQAKDKYVIKNRRLEDKRTIIFDHITNKIYKTQNI